MAVPEMILAPALAASSILFASSIYRCASPIDFQPNHAINSGVVAPLSACRTAAALRNPCAEQCRSFASSHQSRTLVAETCCAKRLALVRKFPNARYGAKSRFGLLLSPLAFPS